MRAWAAAERTTGREEPAMRTPWERVSHLLSNVAGTVAVPMVAAGGVIGQLIEGVRTALVGDPEARRRVAFSIAMIALSAKMAKADGVVTVDEVSAFEAIFDIPDDERRNVARLYDLAKEDVAGFEGYAAQLAQMCDAAQQDCPLMEDILEGLFHIAKADGVLHEAELDFLARTADIFGISPEHFETILARHVAAGEGDPYAVLGLTPDAGEDEVKARYRELVTENHPDRAIARGLPDEFVAIATERLAAFNDAYATITEARAA